MIPVDDNAPSPIPNSYWVKPGKLLAGEYPGAGSRAETMQRLQKLVRAGVDSFVDLTEEEELPAYKAMLADLGERPIRYRRLSITDHSIPESPRRMSEILDYIDAELGQGRCVYVHCRAGIGRTGTTIACHLIRGGLANEAALEHLQRLWRRCARSRSWPSVPETDEQVEFVRTWRDRDAAFPLQLEPHARYEGAIVGLAIGDALGSMVARSGFDASTLASRSRDSDVLATGADTAMTRAVAESLLAHRAHQPKDQLQRYFDWSRSTTAQIPGELKRALAVWQWSKKPLAGSHDPKNLDAHTLARTLAPAMYAAADAHGAIALAVEVSRTTQQSPVVLDLCRVWAALFVDALNGVAIDELRALSGPAMQVVRARMLKPQVREVIDGARQAAAEGSDNALAVTRHALESFAGSGSVREAILSCVTRGRASPSAVALAGALAGACFGIEAIPPQWRDRLGEQAALRSLARHLLH